MTIPSPAKPLTHVQRETLEAYLACNGIKGAARHLRIPEATVRSRLANARRRTGLTSLAQLGYWLHRETAQKRAE